MKIGIISDALRLGAREGIAKAKELGADGVQVYAVNGEICPENLDATARVKLKDYCSSLELEISALCGDLGGHGFLRENENPGKIKKSNDIVDLAVDLGTNIVTTHIGVIPANTYSNEYVTLLNACREIGKYAFGRGVTFAIETGPEIATHLKSFLVNADTKGLGVNLDPANLVMVTGDDPVEAVYTLKDYIVHTHAKDGVKLKDSDPVAVYNSFAEGGVAGNIGELFNEVPLGQGGVDFDKYIAALKKIGYSGFLTIEREVGDDPVNDIGIAVKFLREKLNKI
ncbi:MAG: sugar phosphate isomerase/epimerase [Victivallaceae bacterium]|nr:sugar phosphate isomerase/epimerase [Victivallaceae bacterium]